MSAQSAFVVWGVDASLRDACVLKAIKNVDRQYELREGISRIQDFPSDAQLEMNPDFPNNVRLTDCIGNLSRLIVVSRRVADVIGQANVPFVELLPVKIINHKRKPVSEPYAVVHPLDPVDCLDIARCDAIPMKIDPTEIQFLKRLALFEDRIPSDRMVFRPLGYSQATLVRRTLADTIASHGFSGIRWIELTDYPRPRASN